MLHHAIDVLEVFVASLRRLRKLADQNATKFESEGFSRLFALLQAELDDRYFSVIDQHLKRLKFRGGILISAKLGRGSKAGSYVLRRPRRDNRGWLARIPGRISMVADLGPLRMVGVSSAAETKRSAKSERFIGRRALAAR
jgi:hypothetical protein